MKEAFLWIQQVLTWFFPAELLADPLVEIGRALVVPGPFGV